jgi:hypothetical protein
VSNSQLDVLVIALFALHLGVLASAIFWQPARPAVLWLNAADAALALAFLAMQPKYFHGPPLDWQVIAFAAFEVAVLIVVALALRGSRVAMGLAWGALAVHLTASGLAALFALTFKITRLF